MAHPDTQGDTQALIVGISGPSSSGKTTLARLLQRIFCGVRLERSSDVRTQSAHDGHSREDEQEKTGRLNTFIIHEDDFYFPDDQIPYTTTPSGTQVQDWDTASAIDIPFLAQSLAYVRQHGRLPPRLQSKEDQNEVSDSGVPDDVVMELRRTVEERVSTKRNSDGGGGRGDGDVGMTKTIAFMEGFLLYAPPESISTGSESGTWTGTGTQNEYKGNAPLRTVHAQIHLPLFLPASYQNVKARREGRSGYVTVGPAPEPPSGINQDTQAKATTNGTKKDSADGENGQGQGRGQIDLEKPDDRPPQNFWVDPPGYVDDIVWPRYVEDHAWLLIPQYGNETGPGTGAGLGGTKGEEVGGTLSLVERFGDGTRVREDVGVRVAPGGGEAGMEDVVRWAVGEVLGVLCG